MSAGARSFSNESFCHFPSSPPQSLSGSLYDRHHKSGLLSSPPSVVLCYLTFFFPSFLTSFFLLDGRYRYCNEVIPRFLLQREDVVSS